MKCAGRVSCRLRTISTSIDCLLCWTMSAKRTTPFQKGHEETYGLWVTDVDPKTKLVRSVVCRFCEIFGREEQPGRKRKATKNAQYFTAPFRPDYYRKHNETQHPCKWQHYQAADDKGGFFDGIVPIKNTLLSHFKNETASRLFQIDVAIVDTIIGSMYFDVDDESDSDEEAEEVEAAVCRDGRRRLDLTPLEIKKRALSIFVPVQDFSPERSAYAPVAAYEVAIKNGSLFDMVIEFTSLGSTFRLTSRLAQSTKELTGMACYSGCNRRKVSSFLRVMCASNLQMLSDVLSDCWAFSLALDGATHQSTSYLDIRVHFWAGDNIHNFHLLALPMNERHMRQSMFDMIVKVLDVICPGWRDSLIGVATDGTRNMTGRHVGLLTFLDNATGPNFIRVWCGAHQLDLIMADVYDNLLKEDFYSNLVSLIGYLRRQ